MKPKFRNHFAPSFVFAISSLLTGALNAQSGVWTGSVSAGLWSNAGNWSGNIIADGTGNTADFSTLDLPAGNFTVNLDTARTIGNLTFGDTDPLTAGTWTLANNAVAGNILTLAGTPVITTNVNTSITGVLGGTAGYTKQGAGTLTLTANNSAALTGTGNIVIKAGTLSLLTGQGNLQNAIGANTNTVTFEGGTLALNGSTSNDNNNAWGPFSNPVTVAAGQTGTINGFPRGVGAVGFIPTITGAGTLNLGVRATRSDFGANLAGFTGTLNVFAILAPTFGDLRVNGTGQFTTTKLHLGPSVYAVQVFNPPNNTVGNPQLIGQLSGDAGSILAGNPVNGRFVNWTVGGLNTDSTFAGSIQNGTGASRLYKVGTGTLTLTGENTYTGNVTGVAGTQITGGTLSIGNGGATGSLGNTDTTVASGTTLIFNRDSTTASTYPGILSGAGSVIKKGSGKVSFTGLNTYTAGTILEGGTIGITSSSSLGDPAGAVTMNVANAGIEAQAAGIVSTRNFSIGTGLTASFSTSAPTASYTINGVIGGAGGVNFSGSGLISLGGANTYGGNAVLSSGTLAVANSSGSATSTGSLTANAGTLGGNGTIAGALNVGTGVTLKPGTITSASSSVGTLTTGSLALAGGTTIKAEFTSVSNHDKIVVTSTNGLTSTASLANPILVDLNLENNISKWTTLGTYNLIQFAGSFTGNANDLFEVPTGSQQAGLTYTFGVSGNNITLTIAGSPPSIWNVDLSGLWSNAGNWLNGIPSGANVTAEFGPVITTARTVTLDSNRTVGALTFNNANSYSISGASTLTLNQTVGNAQASIVLGNHTVSTPVSLSKPLDIFMAHATDSLSFIGNISGAGGINKISSGDLTLGGNNTFAGAVVFNNGILNFSTGGLGGGNLNLDNATLVWDSGNIQDITNRTVTFGTSPVTFRVTDNVTLANNFGFSAAPFIKDGFGDLTLGANTTFTGNINVLEGVLKLGAGGTTGSVVGNITLSTATSKLVLDRSNASTVGSIITGTGTLEKAGLGAATLTAANTFSGNTSISAGILVAGNALALSGSTLVYDSLGGDFSLGAQTAVTLGGLGNGTNGTKNIVLANDSAAAVVLTIGGNNQSTAYTGNFSGPGSVFKTGNGTLTLSGLHTHAGGTSVGVGGVAGTPLGGIMELVNGGQINSSFLTVTQGGTFNLVDGTLTTSGNINVDANVAGAAFFNMTAGTINATGSFNVNGNRAQNNSIILNGGTVSAASMLIGRTGVSLTAEPVLGGNGDGLYVNGANVTLTGALTLGTGSATNSTANARIDGGSLAVGGPVSVGLNNGGRWSVLNVNGGTFTSSNTVTGIQVGNEFTGNAAFIVSGGEATVERVQLGQGTLGGTHVVRASGGLLYVGSGGIVKGDVTNVAVIRLAGGTLAAKADWSTSVPIDLSTSSSIKAEDANAAPRNITITSALTGAGSLVKEGGGTLVLNGANNYAGQTEVNAGILTISTDDVLSDNAFVNISSSAGTALNLTHTGTDTVSSFYINNVDQGTGTFGGPLSGAQRIVPQMTGTGKLFVVPPVSSDPFITWANGYNLTGNDALRGSDPDRDGMINLLEFALDSNPSTGANSGKTRTAISNIDLERALTYTLPVRSGATFTGATSQTALIDTVNYTIQGADQLAIWDTMVISEVIPALDAGMPPLNSGWSYRTFRTPGSIVGDPADFIRAKIND